MLRALTPSMVVSVIDIGLIPGPVTVTETETIPGGACASIGPSASAGASPRSRMTVDMESLPVRRSSGSEHDVNENKINVVKDSTEIRVTSLMHVYSLKQKRFMVVLLARGLCLILNGPGSDPAGSAPGPVKNKGSEHPHCLQDST